MIPIDFPIGETLTPGTHRLLSQWSGPGLVEIRATTGSLCAKTSAARTAGAPAGGGSEPAS